MRGTTSDVKLFAETLAKGWPAATALTVLTLALAIGVAAALQSRLSVPT